MKMEAKLLETPIHFRDRSFGKSKIPKFQIIYSLIDLILIKLKDIFMKQNFIILITIHLISKTNVINVIKIL